ncbi:hypothetical protein HN51_035992 [Arachis hypogaea]|uniref:G-type lectin S-receptor-like serine/threonine-protein kinase LECRK1 n=1 Tax=Arachis ipaensis TaxID=130454 RepID=UPI0007AF251B|nr:G-type lectin S-receptor-like serine/threonine-protein kinase LECRK1 [Arachis ipaensis]XP_025644375.1 G-type lectin S-receptor-like serine/threonine-protein kinase LECRK1 [Arachis hypogaea]QHO01232.1 uncharacterized protein DS421_13g413300 [Arachis hypogaea]
MTGANVAAATTALLLLITTISSSSQDPRHNQIPLGSALYPTTQPTSWLSPSGLFAFGFYQQQQANNNGGFALGIWLVGRNGSKNTVVWTATTSDDPPLTPNARLELTKQGKLVLETQESNNLIANTSETAYSASMLDSGNLILYHQNSTIIWQSFDHPTDTILGGQSLPYEAQLLSGYSSSSRKRFILAMQSDGNLVLYPGDTANTPIDAYWASGTFNPPGLKYHLYLDANDSSLLIKDNTSSIQRVLYSGSSLPGRGSKIYRATLDTDGFFRLNAHDINNANLYTLSGWPQGNNSCLVKGICGHNSICKFDARKPHCTCLPGYDYIDPNQHSLGCRRNISQPNCAGKDYMVPMQNLVWANRPYYAAAKKLQKEECASSCLVDCKCWAALYTNGLCIRQEPPLRYARFTVQDEQPSSAFLKVGNMKLNAPMPVPDQPPQKSSTSDKAILRIVLVTSIFTLIFCSTIGISCHLMSKIRVLKYKRLLEIRDLGLNEEVALRRFSYSELKRATNGFKQELGKGSFGAVYKGVLYKEGRSRRLIAVKRLEKLVEDGEREFQAEVRAIGKTHHRNLVRLLGFCAEGPKRLLVYEYMSNGSLGKLLFGDERLPDWDERVRIALDIARGILYLHEECEAPIIHCDIKPQNILMDEFWTAKISDFGLAKLLMPDQTRTFTGVRGTRGYLAPEWNKNTPITVKADIYSYGIVLLETVCCRRNLDVNVSEPNEILLSGWAYKCFVAGEVHKLVHREEVDKNVVENMVKVALWCIQDEPVLRPSMKSVVLMLEGVTDVPVPPCPTSNSM